MNGEYGCVKGLLALLTMRETCGFGLENFAPAFHDAPMTPYLRHMGAMFGTSIIAGIILSVLAPYGTYQMSITVRLIFWVGLCIAGGLGAGSGEVLMNKYFPTASPWLHVVVQSLAATFAVWLCFLVLHLIDRHIVGNIFFWLFPVYIWVISIIICGFGELMRQRKQKGVEISQNDRPAIFERLKPVLRRAELYALSAEDHYVRVHTSKGDDLILMRLSDAIKETATLTGLQTHRSWWVAEQGVNTVDKVDGKLQITLMTGACVPVSRTYQKSVKEAGWV